MSARPILLALLAASVLLVGAPATVMANGDHDHGDADDDGGLPDWVPDVVGDVLRAIGGLLGGIGASAGDTTLGAAPG